jgi:hypothetical protein
MNYTKITNETLALHEEGSTRKQKEIYSQAIAIIIHLH